jgi:hypothetical protein
MELPEAKIDGGSNLPQEYYEQPQQSDLFARQNDLKVIQEYNREENMPGSVRNTFWALASKSVKLGFWNEKDMQDIFLHKNLIKVSELLRRPKHKYTFQDRHNLNQIDFLVYADFKRGIGMERYKINERTLQATSVTQSIQGGGNAGKRGGVGGFLKSFFG